MSNNVELITSIVKNIESLISETDVLTLEQKNSIEEKIIQFYALKDLKTLKVMLFGAYNAGKSTFINTLIGQEIAKVDDVPTTDQVNEYFWNGITLCDTPGINAPVKHQEITDEYLKKIHAVVFIMRETDVDAINLYERMFEMLSVGKNIFIIFNHQFKNNDEEKRKLIVSRIQENLLKFSSNYQVTNENIATINIFPIRLRSACKGVIEGKVNILNNSGFNDFKENFQNWLDFNSSHQEYIKSLELYVSEHILSAIENLVLVDGVEDSEYETLLEEKRYLEQERINLNLDFKRKINGLVLASKSQVMTVLDQSPTQDIAESEINQVFLSLQAEMIDMLTNELDYINSNALQKWQKKLDGFPKNNAQSHSLVKDLMKKSTEFLSKEDNLKQILLQGRKLKIRGLKGRWEKTLGKWAGKGAIAIQVLIAGYELYDAYDDQVKMNQNAKEVEVARYQLIQMILDSFNQNLSNYAETIVSDIYIKKIEMIRDALTGIKINSKEKGEFMTNISFLRRELDKLYFDENEEVNYSS